jgi:hypothetical protein
MFNRSNILIALAATVVATQPMPAAAQPPPPPVVEGCTSRLTCDELGSQYGGSWRTTSNNFYRGSDLVCGESDNGFNGDYGNLGCGQVAGGADTDLFVGDSWGHAGTVCTAIGARLCTVTELLDEETRGSGCNGSPENVWVWSSEACDGGHMAAEPNHHTGQPPCVDTGECFAFQNPCTCRPRCIRDETPEAVRCCADVDVTIGPTCLTVQPPRAGAFLQPADPSCDLTKIDGLFADANGACPGFAQAQCPPSCALAMAPISYGDCRSTITGIVDQSETNAPNGLADTVQRQTEACVSDNTASELAAAASGAQGCAGAGGAPTAGGGGHRRAQDDDEEHVARLALLEAFGAADGSVCELAQEWLAASPTAGPTSDNCAQCLTEVVGSSQHGDTVQLSYQLNQAQSNVYAMAGTMDRPMHFPAAFQVAAPFGADIGGVNPSYIAVGIHGVINPDALYDSWLTVGVTDGTETLRSIGVGLGGWTATADLTTTNGAVFWDHPNSGPSGTVVMAQLTGASGTATSALQGRRSPGSVCSPGWLCSEEQPEDWQASASWSLSS